MTKDELLSSIEERGEMSKQMRNALMICCPFENLKYSQLTIGALEESLTAEKLLKYRGITHEEIGEIVSWFEACDISWSRERWELK
jgi:hypothetical protein